MSLTYHFEKMEVRVAGSADEPLFCAADVCLALELQNVSEATSKLDDDELVSVKVISGGQTREMLHVTESGLYHLIFKSRKAAAKRFRRWVTEEVLPAIRKEGGYSLGKTVIDREMVETITVPEWLAELGLDLRRDVVVCEILTARITKAAGMLKFRPSSFVEADGFQRIPRPVAKMAVGLFEADRRAPINRNFFETTPCLEMDSQA